MPALLLVFYQFARAIQVGLQDKETRGLILFTLVFVLIGTGFYMFNEGWSFIDALYFTVVTLTTVGYGDPSPQDPISRVFTIFYILLGLGLIGNFIVTLGRLQREVRQKSRKNKNNVTDEPKSTDKG